MVKVKMVTLEWVMEKLENKVPIQIVEALSQKEFEKGHLPGAIYIPLNRVVEQARKHLTKDKLVIVYCEGYTCKASTIVARKLIGLGFPEVYDFKGGKPLWKSAGLKLSQD